MNTALKRIVQLSLFISVLSFPFISQAQTTLIFADDFETGMLGPQWTGGSTSSLGVANVFNTIQGESAFFEGEYGAALGRTNDNVNTTSWLDLSLDLSTYTHVELSYWIFDNIDETNPGDGIYFSDDGGENFEKVYNFLPSGWDNGWGLLPPLNVSLLAAREGVALSSDFVIRFQWQGEDDFTGNKDGFFLDLVRVINRPPVYATLPFSDDFEAGSLMAPWRWVNPGIEGTTGSSSLVRPRGVVRVGRSINGVVAAQEGEYGLVLGRTTDRNDFTLNAVDLNLNLLNETDVKLEFFLYDNLDENHINDGIFFSDNGGESFEKVYDFVPESWAEGWGKLPPLDVDALAEQAGLTLTENFVIRFQQFDDDDFTGSRDGYLIDGVQVYSRKPVFASIPFVDDFESGTLGPSWEWNDATMSPITTLEGTTRLLGTVDVVREVQGIATPRSGEFALVIGRKSDLNTLNTTNAVDLYLNLASQDEIDLRFWLWDSFDEDHPQDGLYFSNDGGQSFKKVYDFFPQSIADRIYTEFVVDVDALADFYNVPFTNEYVIRFQQYDNDDFIATSFRADGYFIDDLSITKGQPGIVVWPGDANNDSRVNQADVLPIGLYWNTIGPRRSVLSANWVAQSSTIWDVPVATYADTDGNGIVNQNDVLPIGLNWGNVQGASGKQLTLPGQNSPQIQSTVPVVFLDVVNETPSSITVAVFIEEASDLRGASFEVQYSPDKLEVEDLSTGRFLGSNLISQANIDDTAGLIGAGYSRTEGAVNGQGRLAEITFKKLDQAGSGDIAITSASMSASSGLIKPMELGDASIAVSIDDTQLPLEFQLMGNYPNPFSAETRISYAIAEPTFVDLSVYDMTGQQVRVLTQGHHTPGIHSFTWDGSNDSGQPLASGVYMLRLVAEEFQQSRPVMRVR